MAKNGTKRVCAVSAVINCWTQRRRTYTIMRRIARLATLASTVQRDTDLAAALACCRRIQEYRRRKRMFRLVDRVFKRMAPTWNKEMVTVTRKRHHHHHNRCKCVHRRTARRCRHPHRVRRCPAASASRCMCPSARRPCAQSVARRCTKQRRANSFHHIIVIVSSASTASARSMRRMRNMKAQFIARVATANCSVPKASASASALAHSAWAKRAIAYIITETERRTRKLSDRPRNELK
jgi:hypothetical protein